MSAADAKQPPRLFGTDGVRGTANFPPVDCETVLRLGQAVARKCAHGPGRSRAIAIGKDTRRSGDMLESALTAGICSMGVDALLCGIVPTPAVAFLTRHLHADAGAVISASHNSFEDNGIKLFAADGFKLPDAIEEEIEQLLRRGSSGDSMPSRVVGRVKRVDDAVDLYAQFLRSTLPKDVSFRGMKVVIDAAQGAGYRAGPEVLSALGAMVIAIGVAPDGENINRDAGALHSESLQRRVIAEQAHIGIALDGDADRVLFVDERGVVVDGDEVLAMVATDMITRGALREATVVATVMSNVGLEIALRARSARLIRTAVGDRYVVEEMRQHGYNLGGEQSGHLLFLDHSSTGDGILASLRVLDLMMRTQRPLSELKTAMTKYPQVLLNVRVKERRALETIASVQEAVRRVTAELNDRGRVLVRYSGTEPLIRVMVEGESKDSVQGYAEEIAAVIRQELAGR